MLCDYHSMEKSGDVNIICIVSQLNPVIET